MNPGWPEPAAYQAAVQHPKVNFRDRDLQACTFEPGAFGLPKAYSGGFTTTFHFSDSGNWAVRCFTRGGRDLKERYDAITAFLSVVRRREFLRAEYQESGVRVGSTWQPIIKMEWTAGDTLDVVLKRSLNDRSELQILRERFKKLIADLTILGIAHGDLQHGNIIVDNGSLRLIDYDGMYLPALSNLRASELGLAHYQHPGRTGAFYDPKLDRFSSIVIYVALTALLSKPALADTYGLDEHLLFLQGDYLNPSSSPLFRELLTIPTLREDATRLMAVCRSPFVDVPSLAQFLAGAFAATSSAPVPPRWPVHSTSPPPLSQPIGPRPKTPSTLVSPTPPTGSVLPTPPINPPPPAAQQLPVLLLTAIVIIVIGAIIRHHVDDKRASPIKVRPPANRHHTNPSATPKAIVKRQHISNPIPATPKTAPRASPPASVPHRGAPLPPTRGPADTVREFYIYQTSGRFPEAYALLSSHLKNEPAFGYARFFADRRATQSISATVIKVRGARVYVNVDWVQNQRDSKLGGYWTVIRESAGWQLDDYYFAPRQLPSHGHRAAIVSHDNAAGVVPPSSQPIASPKSEGVTTIRATPEEYFDTDFARISAGVVREYLNAVMRGDQESAYASFGASPGYESVNLTEHKIINETTRIVKIDARGAGNDAASVTVDLQTAERRYFVQYSVRRSPTGAAIITSHNIVEL